MADDQSAKAAAGEAVAEDGGRKKRATPREVPGNFAYTTTPGKFREALVAITRAERPPKFSTDFMSAVLGISGGSARPIPTLLKKAGFLSSDGTPTDTYSKFKSEGTRSQAAYEGLRSAFPEIFKRNEYAHKLSDNEIRDILVEITGLNKNDNVVGAIMGTFLAFKHFVDPSKVREGNKGAELNTAKEEKLIEIDVVDRPPSGSMRELGLQYNINIVLPATDDANVLNAIFKSLRDNLLR